MIFAPRSVRLLMVGSAVGILVIALVIRALADGALEQHSGTLLYGSMVYATVLFLWTGATPLVAGGIAIGFCWLVEFAQLTGIPAELSARTELARLVLGAQFDPTDLGWYPVGIVPLVAVHRLLIIRARAGHPGDSGSGPGRRGSSPPRRNESTGELSQRS